MSSQQLPFEGRPEYLLGHSAEVRWCRRLAAIGGVVVPVYGATDVDESTKAPVLFTPGKRLVSPDLLYVSKEHRSWQEVKAKSQPSWFRKLRRWEHGIDTDLVNQYRDVEQLSGIDLLIVVHEVRAPRDPERESPLVDSDRFLWIRLSEILKHGEHRPDWPGGRSNPSRRGRRRKGGHLWARSQMRLAKVV